jgi:hypothetical protein
MIGHHSRPLGRRDLLSEIHDVSRHRRIGQYLDDSGMERAADEMLFGAHTVAWLRHVGLQQGLRRQLCRTVAPADHILKLSAFLRYPAEVHVGGIGAKVVPKIYATSRTGRAMIAAAYAVGIARRKAAVGQPLAALASAHSALTFVSSRRCAAALTSQGLRP